MGNRQPNRGEEMANLLTLLFNPFPHSTSQRHNVRRSPLRVRYAGAHPPQPGAPAAADRPPVAPIEFLPTSTPGSNSVRRGAPASDRSGPAKSRPATNLDFPSLGSAA